MKHELTPAENYAVCGRVGTSDVVPGSVKEKCFACRHDVVVYPNTQRLLMTRVDEHIKIVCSSCYVSAPDKDRIKPIGESSAAQKLVSSIQRTIRR